MLFKIPFLGLFIIEFSWNLLDLIVTKIAKSGIVTLEGYWKRFIRERLLCMILQRYTTVKKMDR